ncbi:hypothetical protein [Microbispora sp. NPDC049125]|uniref:hypothetical protein n=1 Tax=Microbispora sp. NPDC049125 TaxID=3154929 RepID=UPI003466E9F4
MKSLAEMGVRYQTSHDCEGYTFDCDIYSDEELRERLARLRSDPDVTNITVDELAEPRCVFGVYVVNFDTGERHHLHKFDRRGRAFEEANDLLGRPNSQTRRIHRDWSQGVEIWYIVDGDHPHFAEPDRRVAYAHWGAENCQLTLEDWVIA